MRKGWRVLYAQKQEGDVGIPVPLHAPWASQRGPHCDAQEGRPDENGTMSPSAACWADADGRRLRRVAPASRSRGDGSMAEMLCLSGEVCRSGDHWICGGEIKKGRRDCDNEALPEPGWQNSTPMGTRVENFVVVFCNES